jgi:hypothetical protein
LCILMNQLGDLFLQALVLLHKKLVHSSHFSVDGLKPRRLLPQLIPAPTRTGRSSPRQ